MGVKSEWQFNHTHQPRGLAESVAAAPRPSRRGSGTADPLGSLAFLRRLPSPLGMSTSNSTWFLSCTQPLQDVGGWKAACASSNSGTIEHLSRQSCGMLTACCAFWFQCKHGHTAALRGVVNDQWGHQGCPSWPSPDHVHRWRIVQTPSKGSWTSAGRLLACTRLAMGLTGALRWARS